MTVERFVMMFAGLAVMAGTALGFFVSPWFLLVPAFVGANLFQASLTRFCPLAKILLRMGVATGGSFH